MSLEKALVAKEVLSDLDTSKDAMSPIKTIKKEPIESEEIIEYDFANKDDETVSLQVKMKNNMVRNMLDTYVQIEFIVPTTRLLPP